MANTLKPITILGAGSYGTALAIEFSRSGAPCYLWGHNKAKQQKLRQERKNAKYLAEFSFPDSLIVVDDLKQAIEISENILIAVPSFVFNQLLSQIKPFLTKKHRIVWASKGFEPDTGRLLSEVVVEILGADVPMAVLSGPSFAVEIAAGLPTAITLASTNEDFGKEFQARIHSTRNFRVYLHHDIVGVQVGGAVKNIIAIATGISDGLGFGSNARTALITRGLAEISRLGVAMGAEINTFMGMTGLGDLVLTCTDDKSRNRRFGLMLGQGIGIEQAIQTIGQAVEGYKNIDETSLLKQKYQLEMPITEQVYNVIYNGLPPKEAAIALLGREMKNEINNE